MTDPVDTDELRTRAEALDNGLSATPGMLRAAADEVDLLRAEMLKALLEIEANNNEVRYERDRAERYERDLAAIWAMVENAPHSEYCQMSYLSTYPNARCTCWKAEVL